MADNRKFAQLQAFTLAGSGVVIGATTITLTSFTDIDGNLLTMSDFGTKGYFTLEPSSGAQEESGTFTGVTQNANGTATLTGVKNASFLYPYTETSGLLKTHSGGTRLIITNTSAFYNDFTNKNDDETIEGTWGFNAVPSSAVPPVAGTDLTNKDYVLSVVNGGAVSTDKVVVTATAGETVAAGNLVYLKAADGYWWKTDADTAATVDNVQLGIAQGAGTAGNTISGGVLIAGVDTHQSGLVIGTLYYASNTAGAISSSAGTVEKAIGRAQNTTNLYFNPNFYYVPTAIQKSFIQGLSFTKNAGENLSAKNALCFKSTPYSASLVTASSQYFSRANAFDFTLGTISMWVKPTAFGSTMGLMDTSNNSGNQGFQLAFTAGGKLQFGMGAQGTVAVTSASTLVAGAWRNVTVVWDTSEVKMYLDGVLDVTGTSATLAAGNANFYLGAKINGGLGSYYGGLLDHVRIWNIKLTQQQVTDSLTVDFGGANLKALWTLDNIVTDSSGNGYTLTNNNAITFSTNVPVPPPPGGGGDGTQVFKAAASSIGTSATFVGFANTTVTTGNPVDVQVTGVVSGLSGLTSGSLYYLSDTAGAISTVAGSNVKLVGIAVSTTDLLIIN